MTTNLESILKDFNTVKNPNSKIFTNDYTTRIRDNNDNLIEITIPKNFIFNGANIPICLQFIFGHPYDRENLEASAIHDYLYDCASNHRFNRINADRILREKLSDNGQGIINSFIMWNGVRLFGWLYYKNDFDINDTSPTDDIQREIDSNNLKILILEIILSTLFLIIILLLIYKIMKTRYY